MKQQAGGTALQPRLLLPLVLLVVLVTPSPASGQCRWFTGDRQTPLGGSSPCLCDLVSSCQACWQGCAWNSNCQYFRWADSRLLDWNNTAACLEIGAPPQLPQDGTQPTTRPTSGPVPADSSLQLPDGSAAGGASVLRPSPPPLPPQPSRSALPTPTPGPAADSNSASLSVSLRLAGVTAQQVSEPSAQLLVRRWLVAVMQLGPVAEQQVQLVSISSIPATSASQRRLLQLRGSQPHSGPRDLPGQRNMPTLREMLRLANMNMLARRMLSAQEVQLLASGSVTDAQVQAAAAAVKSAYGSGTLAASLAAGGLPTASIVGLSVQTSSTHLAPSFSTATSGTLDSGSSSGGSGLGFSTPTSGTLDGGGGGSSGTPGFSTLTSGTLDSGSSSGGGSGASPGSTVVIGAMVGSTAVVLLLVGGIFSFIRARPESGGSDEDKERVMTSALSRVAKRHNWTNARLNMVSRVMNAFPGSRQDRGRQSTDMHTPLSREQRSQQSLQQQPQQPQQGSGSDLAHPSAMGPHTNSNVITLIPSPGQELPGDPTSCHSMGASDAAGRASECAPMHAASDPLPILTPFSSVRASPATGPQQGGASGSQSGGLAQHGYAGVVGDSALLRMLPAAHPRTSGCGALEMVEVSAREVDSPCNSVTLPAMPSPTLMARPSATRVSPMNDSPNGTTRHSASLASVGSHQMGLGNPPVLLPGAIGGGGIAAAELYTPPRQRGRATGSTMHGAPEAEDAGASTTSLPGSCMPHAAATPSVGSPIVSMGSRRRTYSMLQGLISSAPLPQVVSGGPGPSLPSPPLQGRGSGGAQVGLGSPSASGGLRGLMEQLRSRRLQQGASGEARSSFPGAMSNYGSKVVRASGSSNGGHDPAAPSSQPVWLAAAEERYSRVRRSPTRIISKRIAEEEGPESWAAGHRKVEEWLRTAADTEDGGRSPARSRISGSGSDRQGPRDASPLQPFPPAVTEAPAASPEEPADGVGLPKLLDRLRASRNRSLRAYTPSSESAVLKPSLSRGARASNPGCDTTSAAIGGGGGGVDAEGNNLSSRKLKPATASMTRSNRDLKVRFSIAERAES